MARPTAYLHIGHFDHLGPVTGTTPIDRALDHHGTALLACGVRRLTTSEESFRAAVELGWQHRRWGYRRAEVEGTWAEACRRARRHRRTTRAVVLSEPRFAGLLPHQAALAVDQLAGFRTHVVVTALAPTGAAPGLTEVLARWRDAMGSSRRLHVLVAPPTRPDATLWRGFCDLLEVDPRMLPLRASAPASESVRLPGVLVGRT